MPDRPVRDGSSQVLPQAMDLAYLIHSGGLLPLTLNGEDTAVCTAVLRGRDFGPGPVASLYGACTHDGPPEKRAAGS